MVDALNRLLGGIQAGEFIRQAPMRQRQSELALQSQEQSLRNQALSQQQGIQDRDQAQALKRMQILNNAGRAIKSLPFQNRAGAFEQMVPRLQEFGIDTSQFQTDFSDDDLNQFIASTDAFIKSPSTLSEFQRRSLDLQEKRLTQPTANERDLKTYQRLREENPEDAEAFGRDVGLLPKDEKLSSTGEKALIAAQDSYFKGQKDAREYELLANDFERAMEELPSGVALTFQQFIESLGGTQDEQTELRRRFNSVRLSEALVNLPPGPATDRDVEEAFKGVPKENASPEQIIMFLRGSAKLKALDNEFNLFKADFISENNNTKGLLKAWQEKMESGDVEALNLFEPQEKSDFTKMSDDELLSF